MSPADESKPLVPYIRQSRTKERTISLSDQWKAISEWAKLKGVKLSVSSLEAAESAGLVEKSVSGAKSWRKREIGTAIQMVTDGKASGIIVAFQDRLARPTWLEEAEVWEVLSDGDGRLVCAAEGTDFRPGDPSGMDARMLYRIKAAVARQQWERHCLNWDNGKANAVARGVVVGPTPTGYDRNEDGTLRKREADCEKIAAAYRRRIAGGSWSEVAHVLDGLVTRTVEHKGTDRERVRTNGGTWTHGAARKLVTIPIYKGLVSVGIYKGKKPNRLKIGAHEKHVAGYAVVSPSQWAAAQPKAEAPRGRQDSGRYLLAKLLKCSGCGLSLTGVADKGYHYYRCGNGCRQTHVVAGEIEALVTETVFAKITDGTYTFVAGEALDPERQSELEQAVSEAKARRRSAAQALDPSDAEDQEVLDGIVSKVAEAEAALADYLAEAGVKTFDPDQVRALFGIHELLADGFEFRGQVLDVDRAGLIGAQRDFLRLVLSHVVVSGKNKDGPASGRCVLHFADGSISGPSVES